jgi:RNA polymerase sigma-70 factor (ECF subfamily)
MRTSTEDESDLLAQRAKDGSIDAFDELWKRNADPCYAFATRLCHNEDLAGDLLAEAALRAFKSIHNYEGRGKFSTWVYRIIANTYYDMARKTRELSLEPEWPADDLERSAYVADTALPADEVMYRTQLAALFKEALAELPDANKFVIEQFYMQDRSLADLARDLHIPSGTVKTRAFRGRGLLKEILLHHPRRELIESAR